MEPQQVEASGVLIRSEDGWRVRLEFDDGTICEQEQEPFATREEAEAALRAWCSVNNCPYSPVQ